MPELRPKFCEFCGEKLLVIEDGQRFDPQSGKEMMTFIAACPHVVKCGSGDRHYTADTNHAYISVSEPVDN